MPAFRFQRKDVHLTYAGHLDFIQLKQFLQQVGGPIKYYSFVHERGHGAENEEEEVGYDHTHAFVEWETKLDKRSARVFDFMGTHPHIQHIRDRRHGQRIFFDYHLKGPINLEQSVPAYPRLAPYDQIREARSLREAIDISGVDIRSVSDLLIIRKDVARPDPYVHKFPNGHWLLARPQDFRTIFVYGGTNTGKTQWALHCFNNPLLVRHMDALRGFNKDFHDGIVFDDMSFAHMPREAVIHLCDWDEDSDIHVRYGVARIPAGTRKIFTSNKTFDEAFPPDEHGAIRRRFRIIHVNGPTYQLPPQQDPIPDEDDIELANALLAEGFEG